MGQSETDDLRDGIRRAVAETWLAGAIIDVSSISDRLAEQYPGAGLSTFEICMEIVRLMGDPDKRADARSKGLAE